MRRASFVGVAVGGFLLAASSATGATARVPTVESFRASLRPVPHSPAADRGSNASGTAHVIRKDSQVNTVVVARGLSPDLPHAMHIHGFEEAVAECPSLARDEDGNGLIDTLEGLPDYGGILVSLTTSGGTGGLFEDGLALDRFPVANRAGFVTYQRTIDIPADVAETLDNHHIVVHGHDLNGNGVYDGPSSSLSDVVGADVPLEAELPVACGTLVRR